MSNLQATGANPIKVAVLTNMVPVYRRPVFEMLQATPGMEVKIFLSLPPANGNERTPETLNVIYSRGLNLTWKTKHAQVGTVQAESLPIPVFLAIDLLRYRPDVIISGELGVRSLIAYGVAKLCGIPLLLWTEETRECAENISALQRWSRAFLIPRAAAFLAWGRPAAAYLQTFKVPAKNIYLCAQAVDNNYWMRECAHYNKHSIRAELGARGKLFLAVGRLVPRKGFDRFLRAWAGLPPVVRDEHSVIIAGGGTEEALLRRIVRHNDLKNIIFTGPQTTGQLAKYYAAADVFVFPSLVDVWGLVVNEAMACGLPVLASRYAGASQQLVENNDVGETFDPNNLGEFTALLQRWCVRQDQPARERSQQAVSALNFNVTVKAIQQAVTLCSGERQPA